MALTGMRLDGDDDHERRGDSTWPDVGAGPPADRAFAASSSGEDPLVVEVAGELNGSTGPQLLERLCEAGDAGATSVIVDLSTASIIDWTGVAALVDAHDRLTRQGRRFAVVCPRAALRRELELADGVGGLTLFRSRARALSSRSSHLERPSARRAPGSGPPRARSRSTSRDDHALLQRYADHGDAAARDALVKRFLPLARHLARRYAKSEESLEDVFQVACLGLVHSIDRYDPNRGTSFSSFAVPTIVGEIKRYFRDKTWSMRVPRELQELATAIDRVSPRLAMSLGRQPSVAELAEATGNTAERILEAFEVAAAHYATSLEVGADEDGDSSEGNSSVGDLIGTTEDGYTRVDQRLTLHPLLKRLTPRECTVLVLRFHDDLTQRQIGERIGVSQMHVSRILRHAIARLHALVDGEAQDRGDHTAP